MKLFSKTNSLKSILFLLLISLMLPVMNANAQKKPITPKDLYSIIRIDAQVISPDGKWILYTETIPDIDKNKLISKLCVIGIDGLNKTQISTNDQEGIASPCWSPKGNKISYIATVTETNSIYTCDFPNGKPNRVASFSEDISELQYSPNGELFSFTKDVKLDKTIGEKHPDFPLAKVRVYEQLPIREWDVWLDENYPHIFYMPVSGPATTARDIMPNDRFRPLNGFSWSPDSKEIAYSSKKVSGAEAARSTNSDVYLYALEGGSTTNITDGMLGYDNFPIYSPDGKYIAFRSQLRAGFESDRIRLMLFDRTTKNITELSKGLDQWVEAAVWNPSSKSVYVVATDKGCNHIFNISITGTNEYKPVGGGNYDYSNISLSSDGKTLLFGRCCITEPTELHRIAITTKEGKKNTPDTYTYGEVTRISNFNDDAISKFAPSSTEERWITTRDGKQLHCWIIYPPNFDKNQKYPLISYCQGGPQQMVSQSYGYRWNMSLFSGSGYIIVAPNRRGCPGFGQDWIDAIAHDWGGHPMEDILDATDAMSSEPFVDKDKMIAIGASAGGFTTFWLEGNHEGRFKAFLSHCGVFNFFSMYGATEELFFPDWEWGGAYWENNNKEFYLKHSPHNYINKWDAPIVISTGEKDFRVPYTQSLEAFTAAQLRGLKSKLLVYPESNHFVGKTQEFLIWYDEVFSFFDEVLNKK
jgi:dipeptidyl aminopeptidase/acylaminoacyl peptidase